VYSFPIYLRGNIMKYSILFASLITVFGLSACDKPTVVNVPATQVAVPGPAGPQGKTGTPGTAGSQGETGTQGAPGSKGYEGTKGDPGTQGDEGAQGETGKTGGNTVIVVPVPAEQK
jgi:hypothetical protein